MIGGRVAGGRALVGPTARAWLGPAWLLAGLGVVTWLRWAATVDGRIDGVTIGLGFGLALLGVAALSPRTEWGRPARGALAAALGVGGGFALVGLALVARAAGPGPSLTPAAGFLPWVAVTVLVASAEEALLRGALFTAIDRAAGVAVAVGVTSLAFALMHVPVYGWHVVPLDLGVGIFLGGLRLAGGVWQAPAMAHAIADLATWWL
jgi:membrane protease YdiL (CAAX protease family)